MKLSAALKPSNMLFQLKGTTKTEAIDELLSLLVSSGDVTDKKKVYDAILERETITTTGIGKGIGIPHGKTDGAKDVSCALGISKVGIEFNSLDNQPVNIIFLIAANSKKNAQYLSLLASISRIMQDGDLRAAILNANSKDELLRLVRDKENE